MEQAKQEEEDLQEINKASTPSVSHPLRTTAEPDLGHWRSALPLCSRDERCDQRAQYHVQA